MNRFFALAALIPALALAACSADAGGSSDPSEATAQDLKAKTCGGLAGLACPSGYECDFGANAHIPDATGTCKKAATPKACGGFAGLTCPGGFTCEMPTPSHPDQLGRCVKDSPAMCGGLAGLACPSGFACVMPTPHHPDQSGSCVAK